MKSLLMFLMFLQFWVATCERSLKSFKFEAPDLFPESFDYDQVRDRFLLGSEVHGTVSELSASSSGDEGELREFLRVDKAGVTGVKVDSRRNRVIVAVADTVGWRYGGVAAYDLDSRERIYFARFEGVGVAEGEKFRANDIALNFKTGDVYVTNSMGNFLWKVTADGTPSVFLQHESFTSQAAGLTGIVYEPAGKFLLAVQASSGALFRVGVEDKRVHRVVMKGDHTFAMADGMVLRGSDHDTLVVVSAESVWLVGSASRWMAANVVDTLAVNATAAVVRKRATLVLETREIREIEFPAEEAENDPVWLILLIVAVVLMVSLWRWQMGNFNDQYRRKRA